MTTTLFMVRSNPVAGREDEYNAWYDETHLPEVLQIEGFLNAQRFTTTDAQVQEQPRRYLAIYEIDSADPAETLRHLATATWLNMSDAIDPASIEISIFTALGERRDAGTPG